MAFGQIVLLRQEEIALPFPSDKRARHFHPFPRSDEFSGRSLIWSTYLWFCEIRVRHFTKKPVGWQEILALIK